MSTETGVIAFLLFNSETQRRTEHINGYTAIEMTNAAFLSRQAHRYVFVFGNDYVNEFENELGRETKPGAQVRAKRLTRRTGGA